MTIQSENSVKYLTNFNLFENCLEVIAEKKCIYIYIYE